MQGRDVHELQRVLTSMGLIIHSDEVAGKRFGETTKQAVQAFQKEYKLKPEAVVDTKTIAAINKVLSSTNRAVRGNVRRADGKPADKIKVVAFDKDLRSETKLGETTCDAAGYFEISYLFKAAARSAPNLVLKAFASARDTKPLATSPVMFDAVPELVFDLVVGESESGALSEYERLMNELEPILKASKIKLIDLVENDDTQDITFLRRQTGQPMDRIMHAVLAHRYATQSKLAPELFYALLRQGLPTESSALMSQDTGTLRRVLAKAVVNHIVPKGLDSEESVKHMLEGFTSWRVSAALQKPEDEKEMTLGRLVKGVLTRKPLQERFMRLYAEHSGCVAEFWKKIESDAQLAKSAAELKFSVLVGNLSENHLPLVEAIRTNRKLRNLADLARLNENDWLSFLSEHGVSTPPGFERENDADSAKRYARAIARAVETAAPTTYFSARLNETELEGKGDVLRFLEANPDFDLKEHRLDAFLETHPEALNVFPDKTAVADQLKRVQRVYRITAHAEPTLGLLQAGYTSAQGISRLGRNAFVARHGRYFDEPEEARHAYARARQIHDSAVALVSDIHPGTVLDIHAVTGGLAREAVKVPQLKELFGSLDFCSCGHCQSVLGPAAYFVDILNFLRDRMVRETDPQTESGEGSESGSSETSSSVLDELVKRRPDLGEIELTCENTETLLPYVDLVLEILEDAVAPPSQFTPFELENVPVAELDNGLVSEALRANFAGELDPCASLRVKRAGEWWVIDDIAFSYTLRRQEDGRCTVETRSRQTHGTDTERAATPQYVNPHAYGILKEAKFPWSLPFDKHREEVESHLAHIGVPRHSIVETFLTGERDAVLGDPLLSTEYLGISPQEADIIVGNPGVAVWEHWGFQTNGTWLDEIGEVDEFLRRSGLTYRELLDLIQMQYVIQGGCLSIIVKAEDVTTEDTLSDGCDTGKLKLHGLDVAMADRIARFVRLWRKLGWTMFDVDRAIRSLGGELTVDLLVGLANLVRLHRQFNLPVARLLAFWGALDTVRYIDHEHPGKPVIPSLFDRIFADSPINLKDLATPGGSSGNLIDQTASIAAALEVSATDLAAIIGSKDIFAEGIEPGLTLENVSYLYRHVMLAKALKLALPDYLRALALIGGAPFNSEKQTVQFVEKVSAFRNSYFTFAELDYLLAHREDVSLGIALHDEIVTARLQDIKQELERGATKEAIARKLAAIYDLEASTLGHWRLDPRWSALADPEASSPEQVAALICLHKISVIVKRSRMGKGVLEWLLDHADAEGLPELESLPSNPVQAQNLDKWLRLINLLALRKSFTNGEQGLLEFLTAAHKTPAPSSSELQELLARGTHWNAQDLESLTGSEGLNLSFPDDFKNERALLQLRDALALSRRLGLSPAQAKSLAAHEITDQSVTTVKQSTTASALDPATAKQIRNDLREKQRSALVSYLISDGRWQSPNDLYGHFLIDVEMSPCMMTSRIKQAISSVQLFVQRCLMNLEDEVRVDAKGDDAWDWWQWMKNYRVWEANRKVFLYPENWLEPELRDDKSPFFKELESQLLQSDLTKESAEEAFLAYVEKLDQVAHLEVMAVCHQKDANSDILHVFARTRATPSVYFYRQQINGAYWTPWEKLDLDIEGHHLVPVIWNDRLFLFWPMFMERTESSGMNITRTSEGGTFNDNSTKYWDIRFAWSEQKQGSWTAKKISSNSGKSYLRKVASREEPLSAVVFRTRKSGDGLSIHQLYRTEAWHREAPWYAPWSPYLPYCAEECYLEENVFLFGGCNLDPVIFHRAPASYAGTVQDVLIGTRRWNMWFKEHAKTDSLNLPIRRDVANTLPALSQTPGVYKISSEGADARVTRNPFFFQDPLRSYLVVPTLSWWDQVVVDPGEIGGVNIMARRVYGDRISSGIDFRGTESLLLRNDDSNSSNAPASYMPAENEVHNVQRLSMRPNTRYSFHNFYHPFGCAMISVLNRHGLSRMLGRDFQCEPYRFLPMGASAVPFDFQTVYAPSPEVVSQPFPAEEMDFSFSGAYASYNWELFFHAPLLIADRLSKNQRFEEAARWFHYIFNPTDTAGGEEPQRYWQTKPFFEKSSLEIQKERVSSLLKLLAKAKDLREKTVLTIEEQADLRRIEDMKAAIKAWRDNPFKPHLVARMRTSAYQMAVVMRYIDNLIAWGDHLFRRDTLETLNEATQLYVLAAEILGKRPVELPSPHIATAQTYNSLKDKLDVFANALAKMEENVAVDIDASPGDQTQQPPTFLYFCLPKNEKLLSYWDTVADRLFKIRHCMNIEGVVRQLPLFEPPIDPGLLVRGAAAGLDINSLLSKVTSTLPSYRFSVLVQKATELCSELKSLGGSLLSTLEKRDGEELSLLRAKHETGLLDLIEQVRRKQLEESQENLTALHASRAVVLGRLTHYQSLLGESPTEPMVGEKIQEKGHPRFSGVYGVAGVKMFTHEIGEHILLGVAQGLEYASASKDAIATVLHEIPEQNILPMGVGVTFPSPGKIVSAGANSTSKFASAMRFGATAISRIGQYVNRELDWVLQYNQAAREIMQIDKQIIASEIRVDIASHELRNHRKQMENARQVVEFMRDKYTNSDLYGWMVGQLSTIYFQAYELAYETAKRAENCYCHELGIDNANANFIQPGYWDSLKKGLMAGEKLHHDLKRMEVAYLEANRREFELTKSISLLQLDPQSLIRLRETGQCTIELPEVLFDMDYPGHSHRLMKSVSMTIPCVTGPFTTLACTLRLANHAVRRTADEVPEPRIDFPFNAIAASSGQNDSGLFELNFRDERYLPFEGAGVISNWSLELGPIPQFDYGTISDVILHIKYTAREGNVDFKERALARVRDYLHHDGETPLLRGLDLRREYPAQWNRFLRPEIPANGNIFDLELSSLIFPLRDARNSLKIISIQLFVRCTGQGSYEVTVTSAESPMALEKTTNLGELLYGEKDISGLDMQIIPGNPPYTLRIKLMATASEMEIEDMLLVIGYGHGS
jgi:hypothetical protein